jgi:methyl-accepting chemotaxis protein
VSILDGPADVELELERYRAALAAITQVCRAAAHGDLEPRLPILGDEPEFVEVRHAINHLFDLTDAYVRESSASLRSASVDAYHRRFLTRGMLGSFQAGARTINTAIGRMASTHADLENSQLRRQELADAFETAVLGLAESVTAAASQLEASSRSLAETASATATRTTAVASSAGVASDAVGVAAAAVEQLVATVQSIEQQASTSNRAGVEAVDDAVATLARVDELTVASREISGVVNLITQVANQTRLLALNATIEAARAGEFGKGFAVVAAEVKNLSSQTTEATAQIEQRVAAMQAASDDAVEAITSIADRVRGMGDNIGAIAGAVAEQKGAAGELSRTTTTAASAVTNVSGDIVAIGEAVEATSTGVAEMTTASLELSRLASELRQQVRDFLDQIR